MRSNSASSDPPEGILPGVIKADGAFDPVEVIARPNQLASSLLECADHLELAHNAQVAQELVLRVTAVIRVNYGCICARNARQACAIL